LASRIVSVRESGSFNTIGKAQHVNWEYRQLIQRADGSGFAGSGRSAGLQTSPAAYCLSRKGHHLRRKVRSEQ
jgi:hypothetical protein